MNATTQRERAELLRTSILAFINLRRQVSLQDICHEFDLEEKSALHYLRVLKERGSAHRAIPMSFFDCDIGQIWAAGPHKPLGPDEEDFSEPIQVTTHHWKQPNVRISFLESLFFPSQGATA